ncbi:MAG TPA: hypothetical protein VMI75_13600 [Polyangiaceae bacterium]|nr:hypothetical protein [Polyangiaceae bacterium]
MRLLGAAARAMAALLVPCAGCTVLLPLNGLERQGASSDAAPEALGDVAVEGGGGDVASEANMPDTAGGSDAASEMASGDVVTLPDADAAPGPFCATLSPQPSFCADFDGAAFDMGFSSESTFTPPEIGADATYSVSAPNSFFATIPSGTGISDTWAYLQKDFMTTAQGVDLAFDLRPVDTVSAGDAVVAEIGLDQGQPTEHDVELVFSTSAAIEEAFEQGDGGWVFPHHDCSTALQVGKWTHVEIVVSLADQTVQVKFDGATVLATTALDPSWPPSTTTLDVEIGFTYASDTSGPWTMRYDDVVATLM